MDLLLIVLPVFLIFFAGWLGQKLLGFDIKSISKMALYIMSPFLAFRTFYTNEVTMDYVYIFLFSCLLSLILIGVTWITGVAMRADRPKLSAMILGGAFMNSGNYGAPVVLFALGAVAFDYAVIMMVFQSFLMNSIGILVASIGGKENASIRNAVMQVVKMPVIYGAVFGLVLQLLPIHLHETIMNAVELIADASIPTVMLVLGMQLAAMQRRRVAYRFVSATVGIRMILSPIVALLLLYFLPISDSIKAVLFIQASMPAAANTTLLAIQFDTEPDLVSFTTFITTIVSLLTIPYVLFLIGV
ncbi:AEC family transporter [Siminovitchia acidinfaciens]|uniref:AEC family transporter n=1 Tax=Siminovitchia acidinfaciens TaxID=2321395 RepID=A0A429XWP2_9BACI|nr:AEC family transporter [Siminovitchia acidinfaciens]RST72808.1 AEC family transporter [Siminovitchia acidinfaciens]